jgi:hypothetical protein
MMTKKDYLRLPLMDKIKFLYQHGSYVMSIRYYGHKINLYLLKDYYVEVFYNHRRARIDKIDLLNMRHSRMQFYFDQINLPGLPPGRQNN